MPDTTSRPLRAQVWDLAGTFLPAALVAVIAYTVATSVDDTSCDGFNCASFGYGVIRAYAAFTAPLVGVLGQLATAGLGAVWPTLRIHPARLGLLGALVSAVTAGRPKDGHEIVPRVRRHRLDLHQRTVRGGRRGSTAHVPSEASAMRPDWRLSGSGP